MAEENGDFGGVPVKDEGDFGGVAIDENKTKGEGDFGGVPVPEDNGVGMLRDTTARALGTVFYGGDKTMEGAERFLGLEGMANDAKKQAELRQAELRGEINKDDFIRVNPARAKTFMAGAGNLAGDLFNASPALVNPAAVGIPYLVGTGAAKASAEAKDKYLEQHPDDEAGAKLAASKEAAKSLLALPAYLAGGKLAAGAAGKLISEEAAPIYRALVSGGAATAGNMTVSAGMRKMEGGNILPDNPAEFAQSVGQDVAFGGHSGYSEMVRAKGAQAAKLAEHQDVVPETPTTLQTQQKELVNGKRPAMLFTPGETELPVPEGFKRVETPAGVFHFDPDEITKKEIHQAVADDKIGKVLDYGIEAKPEDPSLAVVRRDAQGNEIEAVATDEQNKDQVIKKQQERQDEGQTVTVEDPAKLIEERQNETNNEPTRETQPNQVPISEATPEELHEQGREYRPATEVRQDQSKTSRSTGLKEALDPADAFEAQDVRPDDSIIDRKPAPKLPRNLSGAKPNYGYRDRLFNLDFKSDVDRAAYITAKAEGKRSKQDSAYLKFVRDATGLTNEEIRRHGQDIKDHIKEMARDAQEGVKKLTIENKSDLINRTLEEKSQRQLSRESVGGKEHLIGAIKRLGGIRSPAQMESGKHLGGRDPMAGDFRPFLEDPNGKWLFRKNGLTPDKMREALSEEGYRMPLINDLASQIDDALRGKKIYPDHFEGSELEGLKMGPGASNATELPTSEVITDLANEISHIAKNDPSKSQGLLSRAVDAMKEKVLDVKDLVNRPVNAVRWGIMKGAEFGSWLKSKQKAEYKFTPFLNAIGEWTSAIRKSDYNNKIAVAEFKRSVPKVVDQEAITHFIQAGGDRSLLQRMADTVPRKYRKAFEAAANLGDTHVKIANEVRRALSIKLNDLQEAGILKQGIENYMKGMWDRENPATMKLMAEIAAGRLDTKSKSALNKVFATYYEGIMAGAKPKTMSFADLFAHYTQETDRALAGREFIKNLAGGKASDGRNYFQILGRPIAFDGKEGDRVLTKVKPLDENGHGYGIINHPSLRGHIALGTAPEAAHLPGLEGLPKQEYIYGDLQVHPEIYNHLKNILSTSWMKQNIFGRAVMRLNREMKAGAFLLPGFHYAQEAYHMTTHNVWKMQKFNPNLAEHFDAMVHGLEMNDYRVENDFGSGLQSSPLVHRIPYLSAPFRYMSEHLFQEFVPNAKISMYLHALENNKQRFGKTMPLDEIKYLTARQANNAFGLQNAKMIGKNPTAQDLMRIACISPDFTASRFKFAGQALTKTGGEQRAAIARQMFYGFVLSRVVNAALNDGDMKMEHPFSVEYNGKLYSFRSVFGDMLTFAGDMPHYLYNRAGILLNSAIEHGSGHDYWGRKVTQGQALEDDLLRSVPRSVVPNQNESGVDRILSNLGVENHKIEVGGEGYVKATRPKKVLSPEEAQAKQKENLAKQQAARAKSK